VQLIGGGSNRRDALTKSGARGNLFHTHRSSAAKVGKDVYVTREAAEADVAVVCKFQASNAAKK
jgi:hypothetical protein